MNEDDNEPARQPVLPGRVPLDVGVSIPRLASK